MILLSSQYWTIKNTKEKGQGIFSKKKILAGTVIGDYLGKVIKTADYDLDLDKDGLYLMYLSDKASIYPDLSAPGPHLLNHSCNPNSWMYIYQGHTLFFAIKDILPKEEITISYLLSPNEGTCSPCTHTCKCNSKNCTSTMHLPKDKFDLWQSFQKKQSKQTKKARYFYGKNLSPLTSYPKTLPIDPIYQKIISSA